MNLILKGHVGRNVMVYMDDAIIKSRIAPSHPGDPEERFTNLCKFGVQLNPEKCAFGVRDGKLLGFLVSRRGIEANPEKI